MPCCSDTYGSGGGDKPNAIHEIILNPDWEMKKGVKEKFIFNITLLKYF